MPRKSTKPATQPENESQATREQLELFVTVNFTKPGESEETVIEPDVIELNVLPSAFQTRLIERKKARIVKR